MFTSHSTGSWKSEIKVPASMSEDLLEGCKLLTYPYLLEGARELWGISFIRAVIPFMMLHPHDLVTTFSYHCFWNFEFQPISFKGTQIFIKTTAFILWYVSVFYLFLCLKNIPLYGYTIFHLSMVTVSTFWSLWIMQLWTFMYKFSCGHMFSFLLGIYLEVELLGQTITLCLAFEGLPNKLP